MKGALRLLLACSVAAGCALPAREAPTTGRSVESSGAAAETSIERAICNVDRLRSVRVRFRATVVTADARSDADGILLVRRPGALRVKLFGFAGFTVHDATWNGDATRVRGRMNGFGRDEDLAFVQTPDAPIEDPAARLSLVLWSLWQARCARPPQPTDASGRFALDPAPAQVRSRAADVAQGEVRSERLRWSSADEIEVHYDDYDRALPVPLPRRIDFTMPGAGWRAEVRVSEYALDEALPEALFELPAERAPTPR